MVQNRILSGLTDSRVVIVSIALISLMMHFKQFPKELVSFHTWRQVQTQSNINNFYEEDMNILNPRRNDRGAGDGIHRLEFPFMQWLVACLYHVFGDHLIISRMFMFITGLFSVFGMYRLLQAIFSNRVIAAIGAWAFNFSPGFYYYTINPLPDNFALCCSIWGLALFFQWIRNNKYRLLVPACFLLSLGALCKLPFILYFAVPQMYFLLQIISRGWKKELLPKVPVVSFFMLLPLVWYVPVISQWHGNGVVGGIFENPVPAPVLIDYLLHNLLTTLPELLLNYGSLLFFLCGFYFLFRNRAYKHPLFPVFFFWSIAVLCYFLFEINMIADVHDYYLFPFYPILFMLVGYGAWNLLQQPFNFTKYLSILLLILLPFTAMLRMRNRWNTEAPGFNPDLLIYKNELRSAVPGDALCITGNDPSFSIFFYYIDKKGWNVDNDQLDGERLKSMIMEGAQYLYSDSRSLEAKQDIVPYLDKKILEKGSIRVFRLRNDISGQPVD
jgi:hypothetical protein